MAEDLETQPLLETQGNDRRVAADGSLIEHNQGPSFAKWLVISISALLATTLVCFAIRLNHQLPSQQDIEDSILAISNWKVQKIHLDGWTNGRNLNNEGGKALQISAQIDYWIDYDSWISDNSTGLSERDKNQYRFIGEKIVRTACFGINNVTTFDGEINNDNVVGLLSIKEPICVDLHNNISTRLNLTLLLEPNMENIVRVLKKIWKHEYDKLDLSSVLDLTLIKQTKLLNYQWSFPLARLKNIHINWMSIIDWGNINSITGNLRHCINQIIIKNLAITDSVHGFRVDVEAETGASIETLEWLEVPKDVIVPLINWQLRLPDCNNEYTIALPHAVCFTDSLEIRQNSKLTAYSDFEGQLPASLLSDVCWSDEENAVTPMTNLLNRIFNDTELVTIEVKGHATKSSERDSDSIIPLDLLNRALDKISFFPIVTNFTLDSSSLIQDVTINGLKIRWVTGFLGEKRLSVAGKVVAQISLPYYETNKNRLTIQHIKGDSMLYHEKKHFLTIPMKYWSRAFSRIYLDEATGGTMIEVSFDIKDDEVQVENSLELTRVLNEILMRGKAEVGISSNLDILVSSPLGEMALMGLKGKGKALVRS